MAKLVVAGFEKGRKARVHFLNGSEVDPLEGAGLPTRELTVMIPDKKIRLTDLPPGDYIFMRATDGIPTWIAAPRVNWNRNNDEGACCLLNDTGSYLLGESEIRRWIRTNRK